MLIRNPDFAGSWYPSSPGDCEKAIEEFSKADIPCPQTAGRVLGGIVPHAGWFYSGPIACAVIKYLKDDIPPDTLVVFGKHLHPGSGNYIMNEGAWRTPLGDIEIDSELADKLLAEFSFKIESASDHDQDNTIEVQLPFIKYFFPDSKILPIGVPPTLSSLNIGIRIAEISLEMDRRIKVLGSTDLTHYGLNYGFTSKGIGQEAIDWVKNVNDRSVIDLFLKMDAEGVIQESLTKQNACCGGAIGTAIAAINQLGAEKAEELIYSTSYDIRPDDSFVGYAGVIFS